MKTVWKTQRSIHEISTVLQGIVHGTTLTILNAGRKYLGSADLSGKVGLLTKRTSHEKLFGACWLVVWWCFLKDLFGSGVFNLWIGWYEWCTGTCTPRWTTLWIIDSDTVTFPGESSSHLRRNRHCGGS